MVIKRAEGDISYDVTVVFHITTVEKFSARDKKRSKIYYDFRLEATYFHIRPCHMVLINVGQRPKKTVLNQNACFCIIFS